MKLKMFMGRQAWYQCNYNYAIFAQEEVIVVDMYAWIVP